MQVCSGESSVADTAARVRGGAGRESRRRFGRHAWDLERDSLGHGYLARKHHPARVGEKARRWQNVGRSAQELRAPNVGAGQAGAAGAPGAGWRPSRGRGLTELEEAEPGRRAGWLGGRVPLGREGGRERDRPGRGKRRGQRRPLCGLGGTWAARGGIPGREQSTQKVVFVPMAEHSGADSSSTGQGQSPGGSPPCCPAEATGAQGAQLPFYPGGDLSEQLPSQLPLRRQNWLCPWPHPPASVKEEKGPFARGQGHLLPRGLALPHEELQCVSRGAG